MLSHGHDTPDLTMLVVPEPGKPRMMKLRGQFANGDALEAVKWREGFENWKNLEEPGPALSPDNKPWHPTQPIKERMA